MYHLLRVIILSSSCDFDLENCLEIASNHDYAHNIYRCYMQCRVAALYVNVEYYIRDNCIKWRQSDWIGTDIDNTVSHYNPKPTFSLYKMENEFVFLAM